MYWNLSINGAFLYIPSFVSLSIPPSGAGLTKPLDTAVGRRAWVRCAGCLHGLWVLSKLQVGWFGFGIALLFGMVARVVRFQADVLPGWKRFACTIMLMELAWSVWHFRATPASSIDSNSSLQDVNWSCSFLLRPSSDSSTYMAQAPCSGRGACIQKVLFFEQSSLAILNTHHMEYTAVKCSRRGLLSTPKGSSLPSC